jgi:hypothetical protein
MLRRGHDVLGASFPNTPPGASLRKPCATPQSRHRHSGFQHPGVAPAGPWMPIDRPTPVDHQPKTGLSRSSAKTPLGVLRVALGLVGGYTVAAWGARDAWDDRPRARRQARHPRHHRQYPAVRRQLYDQIGPQDPCSPPFSSRHGAGTQWRRAQSGLSLTSARCRSRRSASRPGGSSVDQSEGSRPILCRREAQISTGRITARRAKPGADRW